MGSADAAPTGINQNPGIITAMIDAGADVNQHQNNNITALMFACVIATNPDVIARLLDAGADATLADTNGTTALDAARNNENLVGTKAFKQLEEASN
ncbi:MAG: ankyrin repeat domain-containing protein [Phycisphaerales bacterium]|nr:ankyrin repeat domain-containing protein [Phycisphaerales bacterium]